MYRKNVYPVKSQEFFFLVQKMNFVLQCTMKLNEVVQYIYMYVRGTHVHVDQIYMIHTCDDFMSCRSS